jgi:hypothetical protein
MTIPEHIGLTDIQKSPQEKGTPADIKLINNLINIINILNEAASFGSVFAQIMKICNQLAYPGKIYKRNRQYEILSL